MEIKLAETTDELKQILDLQEQNHCDNVSIERRTTDGFVTVRHNLEMLTEMNSRAKQVIAVHEGKVVAYSLVMLEDFKDMIPVLIPMFKVFESLEYQGKVLSDWPYYVMGQICIAETYRGTGLFKALYKKHKEVYSPRFDLCLTEVASNNPRSLRAHHKQGFETVQTYRDIGNEWHVLVWNWE